MLYLQDLMSSMHAAVLTVLTMWSQTFSRAAPARFSCWSSGCRGEDVVTCSREQQTLQK